MKGQGGGGCFPNCSAMWKSFKETLSSLLGRTNAVGSNSWYWGRGRCWEAQDGMEGLGPRSHPLVCVLYRMLVLAEQIRLLVSSQRRQSKEGLLSLCWEPAGEHGWKAQLSVRLGAGGEVRAECPLFLWALRERLSSLQLGRRMHWSGSKVVCHQRRPRNKGSPSQEL
jgi:hypothetical protein